jgi:hypothetical protein
MAYRIVHILHKVHNDHLTQTTAGQGVAAEYASEEFSEVHE